MILSFIPSIFLPKPVTENWQNWQEYSAEGLGLDRPVKRDVSGSYYTIFFYCHTQFILCYF